ncbi:MAG: transposase [Actinomycetota bacterium]|nr:transposase [Actinomycetota bacterium]
MPTSNRDAADRWDELVALTTSCFTAPSLAIFTTLLTGWVLAPGRRTVTAMITAGDPEGRRAHDAYHRFFRSGRWSAAAMWKVLVVHMVAALCPSGAVVLDVDDTLYNKSGRRIDGAGSFRDAVRSTRNRVVYATGLNLVVVTLRVRPPWGAMPVGVPVGVRLHRKNGPKTTELAADIIVELAAWLPERHFCLCGDGAYACLAGRALPRTTVTSRMRRDAALYEPAPARSGKRGRPRTRGARLATPTQMAAGLIDNDFTRADLDWRGRPKQLLVWSTPVLWYSIDHNHQMLLVIVRDPAGIMHDDFFFTTDLDANPAWVASLYAGRWSIECVNREVKQILGAENPQCWKHLGPERAASMSLWLYAAIWAWYIPTHRAARTWIPRPWYTKKATPSFLDATAALRRTLWSNRITTMSSSEPVNQKIVDGMIDILATAA